MELAAQTGNDFVSEFRFGTAIADCRKRVALFREFLNRLLYRVEIWMRFNGHDAANINADSERSVQ